MLYDIANPSDPYTIDCPNLKIAAIACVILGSGQYAFTPADATDLAPGEPGWRGVPMFMFGGADEWSEENLGASWPSVLDSVLNSAEDRVALTRAFDSVLVGNRQAFREEAIARGHATAVVNDSVDNYSGAEYVKLRNAWHDTHRGSMNDIGGRAYEMATMLRAGVGLKGHAPAAPKQVFTTKGHAK